jgi:hypothetical protein
MCPFDSVLNAMQLKNWLFVPRAPTHFGRSRSAVAVRCGAETVAGSPDGRPPIIAQESTCVIIKREAAGTQGDAPERITVRYWEIAD